LRHLELRFAPPDMLSGASLLPVPVEISGDGAGPGARRTVRFDNGAVVATVTALDPPRRYDIALDVQPGGREFFDHWIDLQTSSFLLENDGQGGTVIEHATTYRPLLHPRFLFAPLERSLGGGIQQHLLDVYGAAVFAPSSSSPGVVAVR
jgi:hypothetical protein